MRKDILQIAETAKKFSPNVSITTNGFYCTDKSKVQELISAGINRFSFSYHSVGGQDEFTKVAGSEKRLRNAIEWVCEEKTKNKDIHTNSKTKLNLFIYFFITYSSLYITISLVHFLFRFRLLRTFFAL